MKILIQSATISDPNSSHHLKKKNVLIQNGRIVEITSKKITADKVIEAEGMILSTGWVDMGTFVGDPGLEYKEDLESAGKAAAAGGFTEIVMLPNTVPAVQSKNEVNYITKGNDGRLVQIHPMGAVTLKNAGEELTEMIDLNASGAVAFSDGLKPVWNTDIFVKSLQYLQKFDGLLINHPEDIWLNMFGQMNEGKNSTILGLKGMPKIAEDLAVSRDVELLGYSGGRLHFARLSSAKALDLVRAAKKKKLNLTCDIAAYQALLDDSLLEDFDTNYKVNPPLREKVDLSALIGGLKDGTIDVLTSGHLPQDTESKVLEFDHADFGIINLQTFASQLASLSKHVDVHVLVEKVTGAPRKLLKLTIPTIEKDEKANLTLFDPTEKWVFTEESSYSKSKNSPWIGKEIVGKAKAVFNNSKFWMDA
ncbi:MAG TPA: dihydroorotase [Cyclobacteriaceae bacterium]|nr:dihydroorotase [Cyclobacteriaceae bacterium]